jgi:hypothetical protein
MHTETVCGIDSNVTMVSDRKEVTCAPHIFRIVFALELMSNIPWNQLIIYTYVEHYS